ncbi:MAG: hypothetical protein MJ086_03995 [Lachnospiraceae bacterium]|nr:hypothetical protein [Lachnospiraceae bacterium]
MPENREQKTNRPVNRNQSARKKKARKKAMRNLILTIILLVVLIAVVIVLTISCGRKKEKPVDIVVPTEITETEPETQAPKAILNEKPVSLYTMDYGDMTCNKVTGISREWSEYEDLESFGAFATSEEFFEFSSETEAHNEIWNSISTEAEYKIGYELSFDVNGESKVITILKPGDIENNPDLYNGDYPEDGDYSEITGYLGVWVYDDMHQDGGFYIHITQAEVTEETLLTSIKLRPTPQSGDVENLVLKAFSYSSPEEFDSDGHYIGNYASSVRIEKQ